MKHGTLHADADRQHAGVAAEGRCEPLSHGLPAALDLFNAELMHAQYLVGVLAALGCDVSREAGAVSAMARRGSDLLAGAVGHANTGGGR